MIPIMKISKGIQTLPKLFVALPYIAFELLGQTP
jgi:hypothetical protein